MPQSNSLASAKAAYDGFFNGTMKPLFSILADDVVWTNHSAAEYSPFAGIHQGVEGVREYFSHMPEIDQQKFEILAMAEQNGYVMVTINRVAKYLTAGRTHEGQIVHVLRFENDKLQQMDIYEHNHF